MKINPKCNIVPDRPNWAPLLIIWERHVVSSWVHIKLPLEISWITWSGSIGPCIWFWKGICESWGLSNLTPSGSRLFKLIGRVKGMRWSCSKRLAYMVANMRKWEREEKAKARSNNYEQEVILEQPTLSITPTPCSLPGLRREETIMVTHAVDAF